MSEKKLPLPDLGCFAETSYEEWKAAAIATLKGADFDKKLLTKTPEGITVKPIYNREDLPESASQLPGEGSFMRGTAETFGAWGIAQAASCREVLADELSHGADRINLKNVEPEKLEEVLEGVCKSTRWATVTDKCIVKYAETISRLGFEAEGVIAIDPLNLMAATGILPVEIEKMYDGAVKAAAMLPKARVLCAGTGALASSGACVKGQIAFAMASASEYMAALIERGMSPNEAASRIALSFDITGDFFMWIAGLRAARVLYANMAAAFGAEGDALKAHIMVKSAMVNKTVEDPYVNMLRNTTEAFSAVCGGVDDLEIAPFDAVIGKPQELSRRVSRNLSLMLRDEFSAVLPTDPAGGSYYVESLTHDLSEKAWDMMNGIEEQGGMYAALTSGWVQEKMAGVISGKLEKVAQRRDRIVGVNMYADVNQQLLEREEKEMICMKGIKVCEPVAAHRFSEEFEALRANTREWAKKNGHLPGVFSVNIGGVGEYKARADFSRGFFETAGFEIIDQGAYADLNAAADAACASRAFAAVICCTDDRYPEIVPVIAAAIKARRPDMMVILAGAPAPEYKDSYVNAGVDEFIHIRANCGAMLAKIQKERGICHE